ncbi:MAG: M23 family metallopeptidase [Actinomycetota bacterium]
MGQRSFRRLRGVRSASVGAALIALVGTGCGQIGGVHQLPAPGVVAPVASGTGDTTTSSGGLADTGLSPNTGDTGGVVGGSVSIDPTQLSGEPSPGTTLVTKTTITQLPQLAPNVRINTQGPLFACPVQGVFHVGDDFGANRFAGGFHPHAGNDMFADEGTPVVAPFDGVAENATNSLGGNAVIVRGQEGYVYNAHLSAFGRLGSVHTGDVIGFVGNTGDAQGTSTHDHFEWHPYAGPFVNALGQTWIGPYGYSVVGSGDPPAVDPYPFLLAACT